MCASEFFLDPIWKLQVKGNLFFCPQIWTVASLKPCGVRQEVFFFFFLSQNSVKRLQDMYIIVKPSKYRRKVKLLHVKNSACWQRPTLIAKFKSHLREISLFWGHLKNRLAKKEKTKTKTKTETKTNKRKEKKKIKLIQSMWCLYIEYDGWLSLKNANRWRYGPKFAFFVLTRTAS